MMKHFKRNITLLFVSLILIISTICFGRQHLTSTHPGKIDKATGIRFNDGKDGFQVAPFKGQVTGPGLVFIEGGTTVMGSFNEDLLHAGNSPKREVSVASFFMDETPVVNLSWLLYLDHLQKNASEEEYKAALPDEQVWVSELAYNDPFVQNYLRHPGFRFYPVVGVSYTQAENYCAWRTNAVNQRLAKKIGKTIEEGEALPIESGKFVVEYRLPTEAEWEYAARGIVGTQNTDLVQATQRIYSWDGLSLRGTTGKYKGKFLANFKRGPGNYKGVPGESDSNGATSYVYAYPPNDLGLYDMVGNVNEWVYDLYRPLSFQDFDDFNPVRRNDTLDDAAGYDEKNNNSLINNNTGVYKGGSWKDCGYWLQIGTRRHTDRDTRSPTIGFRCAMTSVSRENAP